MSFVKKKEISMCIETKVYLYSLVFFSPCPNNVALAVNSRTREHFQTDGIIFLFESIVTSETQEFELEGHFPDRTHHWVCIDSGRIILLLMMQRWGLGLGVGKRGGEESYKAIIIHSC